MIKMFILFGISDGVVSGKEVRLQAEPWWGEGCIRWSGKGEEVVGRGGVRIHLRL